VDICTLAQEHQHISSFMHYIYLLLVVGELKMRNAQKHFQLLFLTTCVSKAIQNNQFGVQNMKCIGTVAVRRNRHFSTSARTIRV